MHFIDSFVSWLASCPYFVVFTGFCSIVSVFALGKILNDLRHKIKIDVSQDCSNYLVSRFSDYLYCEVSFFNRCQILPLSYEEAFTYLKLNPQKIDFHSSFFIHMSGSSVAILLKYRHKLYLFMSQNFTLPFHCVAYSRTNHLFNIFPFHRSNHCLNDVLDDIKEYLSDDDSDFLKNISIYLRLQHK